MAVILRFLKSNQYDEVTIKLLHFTTAHDVRRLLRFGHAAGMIAAMAQPILRKEAQAAPLHE